MIKKATLANLPALVLLFNAYRVFYNKKPDKAGAELFLSQRIKNNESVIFIAFNAKYEAVGFVQLYPLFSSTQMKRLWLLNDLFVVDTARGKGFAKALIAKAKDLCVESKAAGMFLETEKTNIEGNKLYLKLGFVLDEAHNYYAWKN